jgi:hypothetical protein
LPAAAGDHHHIGGEGGAFHVNLNTIAARIADHGAADVTAALGPAASNLVACVGVEPAGEVEIVAIARASQMKVDVTLATAALPVTRGAADALRRVAALPDGSGPRPVAGKFGKRTRRRRRALRRYAKAIERCDETPERYATPE